MAQIETWFDQDLKKPVKVHHIPGNVFTQDNDGNLIGVRVFDQGEAATLSGSVSANVIRPDGGTVAVTGSLSGNQASVSLPQAAYAYPGMIAIVIKLTSGSTVTTLCAVTAIVYRSSTDTIIDPGTIIQDVQALIAAIDEAVDSIPPDYSELTGEVSDLKTAFHAITENANIDSTIISNGYFITQAGNASANSNFDIKKYPVVSGDLLYLDIAFPFSSSGGVFQFQTVSNIPSTGNTNIIGETYTQAFSGEITVPDTAQWLLITVKANETDTNIIQTVRPKEYEANKIYGLINEMNSAINDTNSTISTNSDELSNALYNETMQSVYQTASGWKLLDTGLCQSDSDYKMVKFAVTAGVLYKVVAGDKFQFQNAASVPTSGTSNRVGKTYGSGVFIIKAPTEATYIIISTTITDDIASVSLLDARTDNIEENLTVINWNGLSKNLIGPEAGKLYPVYLKTGTYLTISTSDNQMGYFAYLNIYNSSKEKISYYSIFPTSTVTERTIQLSNDVYYLEWVNWGSSSPTGQLQVEVGKNKTDFEPWYPGVRELKSEIDSIVYETDIIEETTVFNYFITQNGRASANSGFNIKKYRVSQNDILYLNIDFPFASSGGVFQFQTDSKVPTAPNPYIVGTTYKSAFNGRIIVPETAKWLIVTVKANVADTNEIRLVATSGYNTLNDKIKNLKPKEYDANYGYKLNHFKNISTQYRKGNTSGSWYDRFVLMHLSDNHIGTMFARENLIELSKIANDISPAVIVNSGDMTNAGMSSYTRDTTNGEFDVFTDNSTAIINGIPIVATLGNHDANDISNENISHASTKKDQWDHVFAPIAEKYSGIVWGDSAHYKHYHYYDLVKGSYTLRIIALDSLDHDDYETGDTSYGCQWWEVYSQDQIDWLCNIALNVPSGNYGIVIVNHFPFAPRRQSGYSDEWPALNDGYFAQGWKMIPEIVRAWKERTTLSKTYTDSKLGENNITVNADFSSVPSGALFVCYMTGHTHSKNAYNVAQEDGEDFGQLMLCEDSSGQQGSALNRSYKYDNGIQNTAASQVVIDMAERKIYRTAYGVYQHCSKVPQAETQIFDF